MGLPDPPRVTLLNRKLTSDDTSWLGKAPDRLGVDGGPARRTGGRGAGGAVLVVDASGILEAADGVTVIGASSNVRFVDGTCAALFAGATA